MEFMHIYERNDLLDEARCVYGHDVVAVFAQLDVWSTHVLVLEHPGEDYVVHMHEAANTTRGVPPSQEAMEDCLQAGADDIEACTRLGEALDLICGGTAVLHAHPSYLRALADERLVMRHV